MKKTLLLAVILLCVCGCSLDLMTDENPMGFVDPNQAAAIFAAGQSTATTGQAVGVATGNPAVIGISALAGAVLTALGASYLKGKKK